MTDNNVPGGAPDGDAPLTPPPVTQPEHWQSQNPPQYQPPQYQPPQAPQAPPVPPTPQYGQPQAPQFGAPQVPPYQQPPAQYGQQAPQYTQQPYAPAPNYGVPGPGGYFDGASHPDDMSRPLYGASFGQAVRRFFKGYAKFDGRASRSEYWWVALFTFLVQLVPMVLLFIGMIAFAVSTDSYYSTGPSGFAIVFLVLSGFLYLGILFGMLVPSFAIGWRRFHDANFAGPLYLISLASAVPYIGWLGSIAVLVLAIMPSKVEGRRYDVA